MYAIRIDHVSRSFGNYSALNDVSLDIEDHETITVVGPSGCGKSTLMRIVAGLEQPTSGNVWIDGEVVTDVPTRFRNIAMVFQSYALYPHMSCYDNLALNLRMKGTPAPEIEQRIQEAARTLGLEKLLQKKPRQLSGGERQRVAVGRALVRNPRVFLFDEPLSNLDALLRERVRHELKELFRKIRATVIYVTHDQVEALTLADRVVVLNRGRVQQIGPPEELYRRPDNRFVASFIGSPSMNLFETNLDQGCFRLGSQVIDTGLDFSGSVDIGIRPEAIQLRDTDDTDAGTVLWIENLGMQFLIGLELTGLRFTALSMRRPAGATINVFIDAKDIHVFEKNSGSNIHDLRHRRNRCS
jgi:multiple sugar transport system ATP-binding protein